MLLTLIDLIASILFIYLGVCAYYDGKLLAIGAYAILFALNLQFTVLFNRDE